MKHPLLNVSYNAFTSEQRVEQVQVMGKTIREAEYPVSRYPHDHGEHGLDYGRREEGGGLELLRRDELTPVKTLPHIVVIGYLGLEFSYSVIGDVAAWLTQFSCGELLVTKFPGNTSSGLCFRR